ncbi:hypothetical protein [Galbibacter sp. PAP.153]|uniref:hypothetical protein n=1 Tax=Galbibacter sp. PAP.153 TaxID=3104623 RepID=UPI00300A8635
MIHKVSEISGVWKFIHQEQSSEIYFLNKDKYLSVCRHDSVEFELDDIKCEIVEKWREGYIINESLYFKTGNKAIPLFDKDTYKVLIISNDELLIKSLDFEKEEIRYGIYHFPTKQIDWLNQVYGSKPRIIIKSNSLVSTTDNSIIVTNLNDGKEWKQAYLELLGSDKANLHSQILYSDDKLFFGIDGNENRGVFVLDIETGELLKKFDTESYEIFKDGDFIYTTKFQNVLCRINTKSLKLEEWDCDALVTENGFHSIHDHRCDVMNGKFCFTQSLGDNKAKLGVLDFETKELVYKYEFKPENGAIGSIQINDARIFVHTQDNTLHIFEKE